MKSKIRTTYGDEKTNFLARDAAQTFGNVPDISFHMITVVAKFPFNLTAKLQGGFDRILPPHVVKCERARNLTDSAIFAAPGGCSWEWVGNSMARIDLVDGLTVGEKYELTFMVVG